MKRFIQLLALLILLSWLPPVFHWDPVDSPAQPSSESTAGYRIMAALPVHPVNLPVIIW